MEISPERVCHILEMLAADEELFHTPAFCGQVYRFCHIAGKTTCEHPEWIKEFLQTESEILRVHAAPRPPCSLVLFKPDCIKRGLYQPLLTELSNQYKLLELRWHLMNEDLCRKHYKDHVDKAFFPGLVRAMTKAPVVSAIFEGKVADIRTKVEDLRNLNLTTGYVGPENLLHASDTPEAARYEINLWFPNFSHHS